MTNLVDNIQLLSAELLTKANNVANNIAFFRQMFDKTQSEEGKNKDDAFAKAMTIGWQNNHLLDAPLKYKDAVNNDIGNTYYGLIDYIWVDLLSIIRWN